MISLKDIPCAPPATPSGAGARLSDLIAEPNTRPAEWQVASAPPTNWCGRTKPPVLDSPDLRRIIELPRRAKPGALAAEALIELITERYSSGRAPGDCRCAELAPGRPCITRLRLVQAWGLYEIGLRQGLLGLINVGDGKTLLDILAALAMPACRTALLLVPAKLIDQLVLDYQLISQHFRVPSIVVHGRSWSNRVDGAPVLHAISYERLSMPDATTFLDTLAPDTFICDEMHKLANARAVRTGRVLRRFGRAPDTRFCGWSGSPTDTGLANYAHLSALALRWGSPVPLDPIVVEDWARALDPLTDPDDAPAPMGALEILCENGEPLRSAFFRRLTETSGVVTSTAGIVDARLSIFERPAPRIPKVVADALDELRESNMRPDGEELLEALPIWRCARELACGFFYRWVFKKGETVAQIEEWLEARKEWRKEMRLMLRSPEPHLDSPKLLTLAAIRAQRNPTSGRGRLWWARTPSSDEPLPHWRADCFERWVAAKPLVNGGKDPETEAVRLHPYLAEDAAAWGQTNRGVIWYDLQDFGQWVAELSGLPLHTGGAGAGERIGREKGDRSIVASIRSHGEGRDGLQYVFADSLVAHPPSSAKEWHQTIGRLHRTGQQKNLVTFAFYRHTPELARGFAQAMARANYVDETIGSQQKLRLGWSESE